MKSINKHITTSVILLLLSFSVVRGQYVYIPDSTFRSFLISDGFAPAFSGDSLDTTSVLVTSKYQMDCSGWGIHSLEGINKFVNLQVLYCYTNYLTTLSNLPANLKYLYCGKNLLSSIDSLPEHLNSLECAWNKIDTIVALPASLKYLYCSYNPISTFPILPDSITHLSCDSCLFHTIDSLPPNLINFSANYDTIIAYPPFPISLQVLSLYKCGLTVVPLLPDSLKELTLPQNNLTSLPLLPSQLRFLYCSQNPLLLLPELPDSLTYLYASKCQFSSLPTLPTSLRVLSIESNNIDSLPLGFLPRLEILSINNNPISVLPSLSDSLTTLHIGNTRIRSLPSLPPNLIWFECTGDSLGILPILPSTCRSLNCQGNLLVDLPSLPDSMNNLIIDNNPIHCLPPVNKINYFSWQNTLIDCLPNSIITGVYVNPPITNLPLCQPSSGCPVYWNISGNIFHDLNADCVKDTNEQELKNIPVLLDSAGTIVQIEYTNTNGDYSFRAPLGNYFVRINPINLPTPFVCPASGVHATLLTPTDSMKANLDFGLSCPIAFDLISNSVGPETMFRPRRVVKVIANAGDLLNQIGTACFTDSGYIECTFNGPITYVGPSLGAMSATFNPPSTLRWNVNDFTTINPTTDFNFDVLVDTFAQINDPICFQLRIYPIVGDVFPFDNFINSCYPVRVAIDPNEKFMSPSGSVDTSDHIFNFTVFFQNTGNAPAEDIYILDTLDNDLDASTFEFVSSTHPVVTQLLPGNVLRFNFNGVNLVDSVSNELLSHGHVNYRIQRKATTGMGTEITNTAYIFFDQNEGVVTNTVSATITSIVGLPKVVEQTKLTVYPNPTKSHLRCSDVCFGKGRVEIRNLYGVLISSFTVNNGEYINFDTTELLPGLYFISLLDMNGKRSSAFVKQ